MRIKAILKTCAVLCGVVTLPACAARPERPVNESLPATVGRSVQGMIPFYFQMGLLASENPVAFVGKIAYFATSSPDTTLALASVSLPNRTLNFVRDGDQYRAPYEVSISFRREGQPAQAISTEQVVRVGTFREVSRTDESVIFQHYFRLQPGQYSISLQVRDGSSARGSAQEGLVSVPSLRAGQLSTPILVYEAKPRARLDSLPDILPSPRSSATFGQEATIPLYVEGYGQGGRLPLRVMIRDSRGGIIWNDTASLRRNGALFSGMLDIPVSRVGVGVSTIMLVPAGTADTVSARVFLGFGPNIPVLTFEDLMSQLRFFATAERIRSLRETPVDARGRAWGAFLQASDPIPATPEHEGLQAYFTRIQIANVRFRSGGEQGWTSDRGSVYVTLGEPDQIYEQNVNQTNRGMISPTGRVQVWEYSQFSTRLAFYDPTGSGRWQLTPASQSEFNSLSARQLVR